MSTTVKPKAMIQDNTRCIGCRACMVACKSWNDRPECGSRPFSNDRDGFVLGEGAWLYVVETEASAKARGARIYAEVLGYGSSCDAYHRVRLDESGIEPARAMALAMEDAGVTPADIDYVNLHGTATLLNDRIETRALKLALDGNAHRIPMSATKSQIGHPQGASGASGIVTSACAASTTVGVRRHAATGSLPFRPRRRASATASRLQRVPRPVDRRRATPR